VPVDDALGILAGQGEGPEGVEQAGIDQCPLAAVRRDVEQAALRPRGRARVGFVDGGGDAVDVQYPGQHEAAQSRTDDGNVVLHSSTLLLSAGMAAG